MYNRFHRRLISDFNISWIDLRNRFKRKGDLQELLSDDGVHPLPTGYRAMAACILEGLIELGMVNRSGVDWRPMGASPGPARGSGAGTVRLRTTYLER